MRRANVNRESHVAREEGTGSLGAVAAAETTVHFDVCAGDLVVGNGVAVRKGEVG